MADLSYNVKVNTQQATTALNGLKSAFAGIVAAVSVGAIVKFGDSVTSLQNKLRVISKDAADAERQFRAIVQISNESRSSLADVATLYTRLAVAVGDMGRSQQDAAILTDTIAKSLQITGATAGETASAMLQLSQAFSSGVLRGEELNAVIESAPGLARILADSLGVTIGELRRLGEQGKLTSDQVANAFIDANQSVTDTFGKSLPTISQSFTTLQNNLGVIFDDIEKQTGVFRTLANAIIGLAVNLQSLVGFIQANAEQFKTLATVILTVGSAFLVFGKVLPAIQALTNSTYKLATAKGGLSKQVFALGGHLSRMVGHLGRVITGTGMAGSRIASMALAVSQLVKFVARASGIGLVFTAIAGAVGLLLDKLGLTTAVTDGFSKAFDFVKEMIFGTTEETKKSTAALTDYVGALDTARGVSKTQAAQLAKNAEELAKITRGLQESARAYYDNAEAQQRGLRAQIDQIGATREQISLANSLGQAQTAYLQETTRLQSEYAKLKASTNAVEVQAATVVLEQLARLDRAYRDQIDAIQELSAAQERALRVEELRLNGIKEQQRAQDQLVALQNELAKLTLPAIEQKYYDIAEAADASARAAIRAEEARRGAPLDIEEQKKFYDQARRGNDALKRQTRELYEASRTFATGWRRAFNEYVERATNSARQAEKIFGTFTQGLEDLIVDFVKTGKFEWKSFVDSILEELLRSQIQQTLGGLFETLGLAKLFGGSSQTRGNSPGSPLYVQAVSGGIGGQTGGGGLIDTISNVFSGGSKSKPQTSTATPGFGGGIIDTISSVASGFGNVAKSIGGGVVDAISSVGSFINKNLFGGFFANGGSLPAGKFGIVGERGPEMISGPASITPMGATNVTYNISAVDAASFQALVARDPGFIFAVTEQGRRSIPARR